MYFLPLPSMFTSYFLICWVYMRKYCDNEQTVPEILIDLQVFIFPGYEEVIFGMLSVSMYVCK
jgi:hypothetical protein